MLAGEAPVQQELLQAGSGPTAAANALREPKVLIGLAILLPIVVAAVIGPLIAPYDPKKLGVGPSLAGPSAEFLLGTDFFGRDMFSRILLGARTSVLVALVVGAGTLTFALPLGLAAGFFGGWVDTLTMRAADVILSIPWLLVALVLAAMLGFGLTTVIVALVVIYTPQLARVTRNAVLTVRSRDYVTAARAIGESTPSILLRYVLPNAYFPVLVLLTSMMGYAILGEAAISYLGMGVQQPNTSWGLELAESQSYFAVAPHLAVFPGLAIALFVFGMNFLGDGLGDFLGRVGQRR